MLDTVKVFEYIMDWLYKVLHAKIDPFPFHHKILIETSAWYNGMCLKHFRFDSIPNQVKPKTISATDSDDNNNESEEQRNKSKKLKFINIPQQSKEKTK